MKIVKYLSLNSVVFELWNSVTFVEGWIWREKQTQKGEGLRHLKGVWFTWIGALKLFDAGETIFKWIWVFEVDPETRWRFWGAFGWAWWGCSFDTGFDKVPRVPRCFFRSGRLGDPSCGRPRFFSTKFFWSLPVEWILELCINMPVLIGVFLCISEKNPWDFTTPWKTLTIILTLWPSIFSSNVCSNESAWRFPFLPC